MLRVLNAINASILETVDMLLKISRIPIWIMSIICGFVSERRCVTVLVGLPDWTMARQSRRLKRLDTKSRLTTLWGCKPLKRTFSVSNRRSQRKRIKYSHVCGD